MDLSRVSPFNPIYYYNHAFICFVGLIECWSTGVTPTEEFKIKKKRENKQSVRIYRPLEFLKKDDQLIMSFLVASQFVGELGPRRDRGPDRYYLGLDNAALPQKHEPVVLKV